MQSLSKVIKAYEVKLNPAVYQVAHCSNTQAGQWPAVVSAPAPTEQRIQDEPRLCAEEIAAKAKQQYEEILAAAARERDSLLRQAEMDLLVTREQAHKEGYETGYLEGLRCGKREAGMALRQAEEQLQEAKRTRSEMLDRVEPQVVQLAVSIAQQLIGQQLTLTPETVVSFVRQALKQVNEYGEILVRVHPDDLQICRTYHSELLAGLREHTSLDFISDMVLEKGTCRVETSGTLVECALGERLAELRKVMAGVADHV